MSYRIRPTQLTEAAVPQALDLPVGIAFNAGTDYYRVKWKARYHEVSGGRSGIFGLFGNRNAATGTGFGITYSSTTSGANIQLAKGGTAVYASSSAVILRDPANFYEYEIEHLATGELIYRRNGATIATGSYTTSNTFTTSAQVLNSVFRRSESPAQIADMELEYIEFQFQNNPTVRYSGEIISTPSNRFPKVGGDGSDDLIQTSSWPANDSEWIFYNSVTATTPLSILNTGLDQPCAINLNRYFSGATSYTILSGSLPAGLSLVGSQVVGTPTTQQTTTLTIRASNGIDMLDSGTITFNAANRLFHINRHQMGGTIAVVSNNQQQYTFEVKIKALRVNVLHNFIGGTFGIIKPRFDSSWEGNSGNWINLAGSSLVLGQIVTLRYVVNRTTAQAQLFVLNDAGTAILYQSALSTVAGGGLTPLSSITVGANGGPELNNWNDFQIYSIKCDGLFHYEMSDYIAANNIVPDRLGLSGDFIPAGTNYPSDGSQWVTYTAGAYRLAFTGVGTDPATTQSATLPSQLTVNGIASGDYVNVEWDFELHSVNRDHCLTFADDFCVLRISSTGVVRCDYLNQGGFLETLSSGTRTFRAGIRYRIRLELSEVRKEVGLFLDNGIIATQTSRWGGFSIARIGLWPSNSSLDGCIYGIRVWKNGSLVYHGNPFFTKSGNVLVDSVGSNHATHQGTWPSDALKWLPYNSIRQVVVPSELITPLFQPADIRLGSYIEGATNYSIQSGVLPAGNFMTSRGIEGTATAVGNSTIVIRASNSVDFIDCAPVTINCTARQSVKFGGAGSFTLPSWVSYYSGNFRIVTRFKAPTPNAGDQYLFNLTRDGYSYTNGPRFNNQNVMELLYGANNGGWTPTPRPFVAGETVDLEFGVIDNRRRYAIINGAYYEGPVLVNPNFWVLELGRIGAYWDGTGGFTGEFSFVTLETNGFIVAHFDASRRSGNSLINLINPSNSAAQAGTWPADESEWVPDTLLPVAYNGANLNFSLSPGSPALIELAPFFTGNLRPFTFSIASGTLPTGVTLNPSTGRLSGAPTTSSNFVIRATDSAGNTADSSNIPFTLETKPLNIWRQYPSSVLRTEDLLGDDPPDPIARGFWEAVQQLSGDDKVGTKVNSIINAIVALTGRTKSVDTTKTGSTASVDFVPTQVQKQANTTKANSTANVDFVPVSIEKQAQTTKQAALVNVDFAPTQVQKQTIANLAAFATVSTNYAYQVSFGLTGSFASLVSASAVIAAGIKSVNGTKTNYTANVDFVPTQVQKQANTTKANSTANVDFVPTQVQKQTNTTKANSTANADFIPLASIKGVDNIKVPASVLADVIANAAKEVAFTKPSSAAAVDANIVTTNKTANTTKANSSAAISTAYVYLITYGITGSFTSAVLASLILQTRKESLAAKPLAQSGFGGVKSGQKTVGTQKQASSVAVSSSKVSVKAIASGVFSELVSSTQYGWAKEAISSTYSSVSVSWEMFGTLRDVPTQVIMIFSNEEKTMSFFSDYRDTMLEFSTEEYSNISYATKEIKWQQ